MVVGFVSVGDALFAFFVDCDVLFGEWASCLGYYSLAKFTGLPLIVSLFSSMVV
jgi:hypothetical protein